MLEQRSLNNSQFIVFLFLFIRFLANALYYEVITDGDRLVQLNKELIEAKLKQQKLVLEGSDVNFSEKLHLAKLKHDEKEKDRKLFGVLKRIMRYVAIFTSFHIIWNVNKK